MSAEAAGVKSRVLLSGAATLVGSEVLRQLAARPDIESVRLLLSANEGRRDRALAGLAAYLGPLPPSVTAVPADLRLPRFGLSLAAWEELGEAADLVLHCAQREVQDQNLELARQANLRPVEGWIQLLGRNPALRLHHLSTSFVAGTRRGLLTEFDLDCGQGFHNAWERSKFEAELRLRESPAGARIAIYRPSHTLGRAADGGAIQLGGSYPLLASLAAAALLPGDGQARVDFVPADYVAAAMVALAFAGAQGTFHLASGWEASLPVQEAAVLVAKGCGRSRHALLLPRAFTAPLRLAGSATRGGLASRSLAFTTARDLLHQGPVFDSYLAERALAPLGLACPAPASWLETVVRAAEARRWESPPADELAEPVPAQPPVAAAVAVTRQDPAFQDKRFHHIGEVDVAYRDLGEGEPVVFFHGFAGAHSWDAVVERVIRRRRAIVIETLGISDSEAPPSADFGLPAQAARARGLLSALGIQAAHVVGNDTGGVIAQMFAVRWPQCIKSLVLSDCDAHDIWPPPQVATLAAIMGWPGGTRLLTALMKIPAVARSHAGFRRMVHDKKLLTRERLEQYLAPVAASRERRTRLKRFFRSFAQADLDDMNHLLEQLEVPTLVIWGADNEYWSPSWGKRLHDAIPGARRLELIPFAGISCHEERPDLFSNLIDDFFGEIESETAGR